MSPDDPRHGSEAGYSAHMRSDKSPCRPCREAKNLINATRDRYHAALIGGRWVLDRRRRVQVWVPDVVVMHPSEWQQIEQEAS